VLFSIFTGIGKTLIEMEEAVRVKLQERKKIFLIGSGFTREREHESKFWEDKISVFQKLLIIRSLVLIKERYLKFKFAEKEVIRWKIR
jgi:hypothetical protein